jgi:sec-independent protein translocase protein TatA
MPGIGYTEMMIFGVLALLLFGGNLPEVARSLGSKYRDLRKMMNEFQREFQGLDQWDRPAPPSPRPLEDDESSESTTTAPRFTPPSEDEPSQKS